MQGEVWRQQREARREATRGQESLLCSQQSADQPHLGGLGPQLTPRLYHEGTQDSGVSCAPVFLGSDAPKMPDFSFPVHSEELNLIQKEVWPLPSAPGRS